MKVIKNLSKENRLHHQGGSKINVIKNCNLEIKKGECVALTGSSGSGKSTLIRMIYGNYLYNSGQISIDGEILSFKTPRKTIELRRSKIGYVSQFLRVIPRVKTIDTVLEPLLLNKIGYKKGIIKVKKMLKELNINQNLWELSPSTFSGGEQQRVNIARGFIFDYPVLLLDEPTASLDNKNRDVVLSLIKKTKKKNTAILGIFHDQEIRKEICDREIDVSLMK